MMRSIRDRKPNALLVNENHPEGLRWGFQTMDTDLEKLRTNLPRLGGSVLIVEDINEQCGQFLLTKFGQEVSPEFLARHMIRLDSQSAVEHAKNIMNSSLLTPEQHQRLRLEDRLLLALTSPLSKDTNGFHVDCDFSSVMQSPSAWGTTHVVNTFRSIGQEVNVGPISIGIGYSDGPRYPHFVKTSEVKIQRTRTRMSCCQLEADFCEDPPNLSKSVLGAD